MQDLIKFLITSIINKKDKFTLTESQMENGLTNYVVGVDPLDMGRVIGKKGKIISALRTLVRTRALKEGKKVLLTLAQT